MKPEIWVKITVETADRDMCATRTFLVSDLENAEGMETLWTHYCVCRMKLGKKQKEQDYSDAEIERSQINRGGSRTRRDRQAQGGRVTIPP